MSIGRFILAALAGALLCYWALFLFVVGGMVGEIYWTGNNRGTLMPGYLVSLYAPPIIAGLIGYLSLRHRKRI